MSVKITIEGDGLSFKKETSLQKAGQILAFLGSEETSASNKPLQAEALFISPASSNQSPKDLLDESKAKTNSQKITVIGKYLADENGVNEFLSKEVLSQLRKLGDEPGNFKRDLGTAEDLQYIYPIPSKKGFYGITARGEGAIQDKFTGETQAKIKPKGKGVFKKANPPRDSVTKLPIATNLEGFPNFHDLPTKADKILWALAYADKNGIQDLTPREVEFITDKLKGRVAQSDFSAHNKKNRKAGYVSLTDGVFKLQQNGIDHLKKLVNPKGNVKNEEE